MFDVLHTVINSVYVQTLPTEQATSVVTDFFSRGHDPFAHACEARPLTIVGRTFFECVIVIVILAMRHEARKILVIESTPRSTAPPSPAFAVQDPQPLLWGVAAA